MSDATQPVAALGPREVCEATHEKVRKALLAAGFVSSLLYVVATDVVAARFGTTTAAQAKWW